MLAEYLPLPLPCPYCPGRRLFRAYRDVLSGERVVKVECIAHRHPVVDRAYTGTAKSNWGTVGAMAPGLGHGPALDTSHAEPEVRVPTPEEVERAVKDALEEMRAADAQEA